MSIWTGFSSKHKGAELQPDEKQRIAAIAAIYEVAGPQKKKPTREELIKLWDEEK